MLSVNMASRTVAGYIMLSQSTCQKPTTVLGSCGLTYEEYIMIPEQVEVHRALCFVRQSP
jgi:hypothetical protein